MIKMKNHTAFKWMIPYQSLLIKYYSIPLTIKVNDWSPISALQISQEIINVSK